MVQRPRRLCLGAITGGLPASFEGTAAAPGCRRALAEASRQWQERLWSKPAKAFDVALNGVLSIPQTSSLSRVPFRSYDAIPLHLSGVRLLASLSWGGRMQYAQPTTERPATSGTLH